MSAPVAMRRIGRFIPGGVLGRKLVRDLLAHKAALAALAAVVTIGVGTLIAFHSIYRDLHGAAHGYFRMYRLADFVVDMKRAPENAVEIVRRTPGVVAAQGRVSIPALLDLPHVSEPIGGLAISMPERRVPVMNDVRMMTGTWFSGRDRREAIVNDSFAKANGLRVGDRLKALLIDQQHELLIVGTAVAPEFTYLIPADGGIAPDPARFGVFYMQEEFLQESADLEGAYNQILGRAADPSPAALDRVFQLLQTSLDPWGVTDLGLMTDRPSVRFILDELEGLRASSRITPTIFLVVSVLIMNVLMSRMVQQQRTIIGTLKAVGRSSAGIVGHYVGFGAAMGLLGGLGGCVFAWNFHPVMVGVYRGLYSLPTLEVTRGPHFYVAGVAVSVGFACLGTIRGALEAARLQPADAMRPPPPEKGVHVFLERFPAIWSRLNFRKRLVLRAILRNPYRSTVSFLTTLVSTSLMVMTYSMVDSLNYLMEYQFSKISHQDMTVSVRDPLGWTASGELASISGVASVEPQLAVVCDFVNGPYKKRTAVTGLPKDNRLATPLDSAGRPIVIPPEGLVLSDKLARILHLEPGDTVSLRPLIARRDRVEAPVVAITETYLGLSAYADIAWLSRLLGEDYVANMVLQKTFGEGPRDGIHEELELRPTVIGVSRRERAFSQMQETFGKVQSTMLVMLIGFAGMIAFGSVLNNAFVSLSEREREVGVFRVVGYSAAEIASILRGEIVLIACFAVLLGMPAGLGLTKLVSMAYDTEMYRFPAIVPWHRYVQAAAIVSGFVALAQVIVYGMIRRLDWMEAIKIKE